METRRRKQDDKRQTCTGTGANSIRRWTAMLRRIKQAALLLIPLFVVMAAGAEKAFADNPVSAYITIRCTATISIELFSRVAGGGLPAKTTYYNFGDVAAASTATAVNPIGVRNNSQGAITRLEMDVLESGGYVDPITQWRLGSTQGLNRAVLFAKFSSSTITADDFNVSMDTVSTTSQGAKTYSNNTFYGYCSQYIEPSYTSDASLILPVSYDGAAEGRSERQLWLKLLTPTAVESPNQVTNITLRLTAK